MRVSYGHEITARAATPEWHARGGQCIVVRETPVSYPGGTPIFGPLPFRGDILEMKNPLWEFGLVLFLTLTLILILTKPFILILILKLQSYAKVSKVPYIQISTWASWKCVPSAMCAM